MKAILTLSPGSRYNDLPEKQYHFPHTYLKQIKSAIGDWIIYYEPRRDDGIFSSGGRQSYFAVAQIKSIYPDQENKNHYYAEIINYLGFDRPVPFREDNYYYEAQLRKADGTTNRGAFGRAVRKLRDEEFQLILQAGFLNVTEPWEKPDAVVAEEHPIIEQLIRRRFRDRAFQRQVRLAYNNTCAITGLCLTNGGGRPEVEAAHIRPVEDSGPDSLRNGLALTGTVHWLFDRGLITLDDHYRLIIVEEKIPHEMMQLLRPGQFINLPEHPAQRPHPGFLHWHRENKFCKINTLIKS